MLGMWTFPNAGMEMHEYGITKSFVTRWLYFLFL